MTERILGWILEESKWLATAMSLAIVTVAVLAGRGRRRGLTLRAQIPWAMNLFYGCVVGVMAFGHLLAVTVKLWQGTLEGALWILYPIGLVLVVPAAWLILRSPRLLGDDPGDRKAAIGLNLWLGVSLMAIGPQNGPLAAPAALNIAYHLHSRRLVGWGLVGVTTTMYLLLFVGSLVFLAAGGSFEQFSGME